MYAFTYIYRPVGSKFERERIYSPKPEYAHVTCDVLDNPELELEAIKPTKTRRSPHFVRKKKKKKQ